MTERTCLRPGCTTQMNVIGVCVACANSEYEPKSDGVQFRNEHGQFEVTDPDRQTNIPKVGRPQRKLP